MIYPWQQSQWAQLYNCLVENKLPQALLFVGQSGMGKSYLAEQFAAVVLTHDSPESTALFQAGNHPDYYCIEPEEGKRVISVNQIRVLQKQLQQKSHISQYKVVIIEPADAMNIAARNALLKTLEEPMGDTVIILISSQPKQLSATIRSRCRIISFAPAHDAKTIAWLQAQLNEGQDAALLLNLAHGAPLNALAMLDGDLQTQRKIVFKDFIGIVRGTADPVQVAQQWQKYDIWQMLSWLQTWLLDVSRVQAGIKLPIENAKYQQAIAGLAGIMTKLSVFNCLDEMNNLKQALAQVNQINPQLALEKLLIGICYDRKAH